MVAFALASAGAVSTNVAKETATAKPVITGFIQNGSITNCPSRVVDCTTVNTGPTCMSSDLIPKQVWLKNGLDQCIIDLYRVVH
jgi:hypothetical protein